MRAGAFVAIAYVLLLAWGVAAQFVPVHQAAPDLALLPALYLGLFDEGKLLPSLAASIFIGYLADVMGGAPHGLYACAAALVFLLGHALSGRFFVRGILVVAVAGFLASAIGGTEAILVQLEAGRVLHLGLALRLALAQAGLTALCAPPCFWIFRAVDARRMARREVRRSQGAFS